MRLSWAFVFASAGLMSAVGSAQMHTASVRGVVLDSSDLPVSEADVLLTSVDRQRTWRRRSDTSGEYVFVQVPAGEYEIAIQAIGFAPYRRTGIALHVGQTAVVDLTLELTGIAQSITVAGHGPLTEPATTWSTQVVTGRTIRSSPLNARNVTALIGLIPGISATRGFRTPGFSSGSSDRVAFSASGGRRLVNEVILDGSPQIVMGENQPAYIPSPEAVEEFNVQSGALPADFGRTGAAVVNVVHRSGGAAFHGAVYTYLRNAALNANGFFQNRNGAKRAASRTNEFGVALGGPLTPSRRSTFFFLNAEATRVAAAQQATSLTVPTGRMRSGDFSEISQAVYDPWSVDTMGRRRPFVNNLIPSSRWNSVGLKLLEFFPLPTSGGVANNFFTEPMQRISERNFSFKLDRRLTDAHHLFGRLSWHGGSVVSDGPFDHIASPGAILADRRNRSATLDHTIALASWVLHANYGYVYCAPLINSQSLGFDVTLLGFPVSMRENSQIALFPAITLTGLAGLGPNPQQINGNKFETHSASGDATTTSRGHTLEFGGSYRSNQASLFRANAPAGLFSFTHGFTRESYSSNRGGHPAASLLLGLPAEGRLGREPALSLQVRYAALYLQDSWRAARRLTLNIGLRWDTDRPLTERFNRTSWFDPDAILPLTISGGPLLRGGLVFAGRNGRPRGNKDSDNNNFAPRVGLAWQPREKLVLRSGFGVLYSPTTGGVPTAANTGAHSFNSVTSYLASPDSERTPSGSLSNPFPYGFAPAENASGGLLTYIGQELQSQVRRDRVPYSMHWNFGLQQEAAGDLLLDVAYAGSAGVRLPASTNLNQLPDEFLSLGDQLTRPVLNPFFGVIPQTSNLGALQIPAGQLLRPYPHFDSVLHVNGSIAHSSYHALQAKLRKRYGRALQLQAAYTWSKLLDDASGITAGDQLPGYANHNRRDLDKSISALDIAHRLVASFEYELPFGAGQRFASRPGLLRAFAGGWTFHGIATLQSGPPIAITSETNRTGSFGGLQRPDSAGVTSRTPGGVRERVDNYFDRAAFSNAAPFTFGNLGRFLPDNRGPGFRTVDMTLLKLIPVSETSRVEIRAAFFNLLNTVNFLPPVLGGTAYGSSSFGRITSAEAARVVQIGLVVRF